MNTLLIIDVVLLILFTIWVIFFIKTRKHNLKREGWMYLYKTQLGVNLIDKFTKKYSKLLHFLKWPIIILGFLLMISILILLIQTVWVYISFPQITQVIKAPPVMPLIPYFPQIFGVESLMPPFYFIYFILALLIVAVVHEFAHGIYMRLYNVRIKSTGFAFLGPILGAFVEQNEKDLIKRKNSEQMTILAAGVFANIITFLVFFLLLILFFNLAYDPSGYIFNSYAYETVNVADITGIGNSSLINFTEIYTIDNKTYLIPLEFNVAKETLDYTNYSSLLLFMNSPAIKNQLQGIITEIDGQKIIGQESLSNILSSKKPGEQIKITTLDKEKNKIEYNITLESHPLDSEKAFLGISSSNQQGKKSILGKTLGMISNIKLDSTYYEQKILPSATEYLYNLIWWIMMINLFVALFNMLPLGILDGGRFFYLTVLSLTKSEKVSSKSFKYMTRLIGLIFLAMIIFWLIAL